MDSKLVQSDEGWKGLIDFLSDWYWEQDKDLRFTMMTGKRMREKGIDNSPILGKLRWEQDRIWDPTDPSWEEHKATLYAHKPFSNFTYKIVARNGELRYISISGAPFFDGKGEFAGYRGIGKDVTREVRAMLRRTIEHAVTDILSTANSINDCVPQIIKILCETLNWACGVYWEYIPEKDLLKCGGNWSNGAPGANRLVDARTATITIAHNAQGILCKAWEKGDTVWVPDIATENEDASLHDAIAELHSAFALPIKSADQVVAVLEFYSDHIHQPDTDLLDCAAFLSSHIGQFSQLTRARRQLVESEERFRSLVDLSSDWIWEQDDDFRFTFFEGNQSMQESTGVSSNSRVGLHRWDTPALNLTEDDWAKHREMLTRHETFEDFLVRLPDVDGREQWLAVSGMPIYDADDVFKGYRGIAKDVSERKNSEQRIEFLATHDPLTGLPNRTMFSELLNQAILLGRRYSRKFAVFFIDLDRFKVINDSLGHEAGDTLLKTVSERLLQCVRKSDVVARLGGDEFVVLLHEVADNRGVENVAKKILATLFKPVVLMEQECHVTGSIGICLYPDHAQDEQTLIKNADAAMYQAKESGKNQLAFYSSETKLQSLERVALESSLRHAIEREQLLLHYQAKLDLKTRQVSGVEALLRWEHPELGMVAPGQFIPLAEETGLIIPMGRWVLETACTQAVVWHKAGMPNLVMAVNVSPRQFSDECLLDDVRAAMERTGIPPHLLELELTESMVVHKPERAIKILKSLKALGVRIAIDDFGTGYSSLAQLKNFPIDTLKVDRSFIQDVSTNLDDQNMTKAIIAMGKSLGLNVVAEGVETEEQETFLTNNDCDESQGFFFSKPLSAEAMQMLLG